MKKSKKVIVLYGPPGVGKLTVAQELAKNLNYTLFHVHALADLLSALFGTGTSEFSDSFVDLWLYLFKKVLTTKIDGIVVTLVYGVQTLNGKNDDAFFADILQAAHLSDAEIYFFKLQCADEQLIQRVQAPSRKKFNKLTDPSILKYLRETHNIDKKVPGVESIEIDTTLLSPIETVQTIINRIFL